MLSAFLRVPIQGTAGGLASQIGQEANTQSAPLQTMVSTPGLGVKRTPSLGSHRAVQSVVEAPAGRRVHETFTPPAVQRQQVRAGQVSRGGQIVGSGQDVCLCLCF